MSRDVKLEKVESNQFELASFLAALKSAEDKSSPLKILELLFTTLMNPKEIDDRVAAYAQLSYRIKDVGNASFQACSYSFAKENGFFGEFSKKGGLKAYQAACEQYRELETHVGAEEDSKAKDQGLIDAMEETSRLLSKTFQDLENLATDKLVFAPKITRIAGICSRCGVDKSNDFATLLIMDAVVAHVGNEMLSALPRQPEVPSEPLNLSDTPHPDIIEYNNALVLYEAANEAYLVSKKNLDQGTEIFIKNIIQEFNAKSHPAPGLLFVYDSTDKNEGLDFKLHPAFKSHLQEKIRLLQPSNHSRALPSQEPQEPQRQELPSPKTPVLQPEEIKLPSLKLQKPPILNQEKLQKLKEQCQCHGLEFNQIRYKTCAVMEENRIIKVVEVSMLKQKLPLLPITPWLESILNADFEKFKKDLESSVNESEKQVSSSRNLKFYAQISLTHKHIKEKITILQSIANDKDQKANTKENTRKQIAEYTLILDYLNNHKKLLHKQLRSYDTAQTLSRIGMLRINVPKNSKLEDDMQIEAELEVVMGLRKVPTEKQTSCLIS